jgi:hypothetical protein
MAQDENAEHPALKNYSGVSETVKSTVMGALKWGLIGLAVIGGGMALASGVGVVGGAIAGGVIAAGAGTLLFPGVGTAVGGLVGAAGGGLLGLGGSWLGGTLASTIVGGTLKAVGLGAVAAIIPGGIVGGLIAGAIGGAAIGIVSGLLNSGEANEKKKQQLVDNYERNEMRQERREAMGMRHEMSRMNLARQAQAMGVSPDSLPRGMSTGRQMA